VRRGAKGCKSGFVRKYIVAEKTVTFVCVYHVTLVILVLCTLITIFRFLHVVP